MTGRFPHCGVSEPSSPFIPFIHPHIVHPAKLSHPTRTAVRAHGGRHAELPKLLVAGGGAGLPKHRRARAVLIAPEPAEEGAVCD